MNNSSVNDSSHSAFFSLLRAGLWSTSAEETYFPLSEEHWLEVFRMARKQTVEGIVYDGIMTLPSNLYPPKDLLLKWIVVVDSIEQQNQQMGKRIQEVFTFFERNRVNAYLLKGHSVAACYEQPNHRVCGDIDVYFLNPKDYKKVYSLLRQKGIRTKKTPGFSAESVWKKTLIEHHEKLLDIHNPLTLSRIKGLTKQESTKAQTIEINGQKIPSPSPLLTTLLVNTHILKHTLSFGIGLRQLCDAARIYQAYYHQIDGIQLKKTYKEVGILRWVHVLNQVLVKDIGLDSRFLPFELEEKDDSDWMINEVMEGGNFGFEDTRFGKMNQSDRQRKNTINQLLHRFRLNIRYAPGEAIFFPVEQIFSRIATYF